MGQTLPVEQNFIRKLSVDWSDQEGDYVYSMNTLVEYENGERERRCLNTGDKSWAKRIAKHYSLELPEVKK